MDDDAVVPLELASGGVLQAPRVDLVVQSMDSIFTRVSESRDVSLRRCRDGLVLVVFFLLLQLLVLDASSVFWGFSLAEIDLMLLGFGVAVVMVRAFLSVFLMERVWD
jgi:hypothetical protein